MKNRTEESFNGAIFECIDRALDILGESPKVALYHQMTKALHLEFCRLQSNPLEITQYIRKILGESGYLFIERLIVQDIARSFGLKNLRSGSSLEEAILEARKNFLP
jgi:hypothetical protein